MKAEADQHVLDSSAETKRGESGFDLRRPTLGRDVRDAAQLAEHESSLSAAATHAPAADESGGDEEPLLWPHTAG